MDTSIFDIVQKYIHFIKNTQTGEIIYRCPMCGDSDNNYHGHFYVNRENMNYICFKCGTKGRNVVQFILELIDNGSIEEYEVLDKQYMVKYILKKLSRLNKQSNSLVTTGEDQIGNVISDQEEKRKAQQYDDEETFLQILLGEKTYSERFVIDTALFPYYLDRTKGQADIQKQLVEERRVIFYYSETNKKCDNFTPNLLLNRIYFKHGNSFYTQRKVSDQLEPKSDIKKYLYYHSKNSNRLEPFVLQECSDDDVGIVYFVEGIFDSIKLYQFTSTTNTHFATYTLNGKNLSQYILDIIKKRYKNLKMVIVILDNDVKEREILTNISKFDDQFQNKTVELYIGNIESDAIKDLGEMTAPEQLKLVQLNSQSKYQKKNVMVKIDMIRNYLQDFRMF